MQDEKKKVKTKKKTTIRIPTGLRNESNAVLKTRLSKKHLQGERDHPLLGSVMVWESKGVEYMVPVDDFRDMKFKKPRVYTDQKKNLYLLASLALSQKELPARAKEKGIQASFTLGEYLRAKGYGDKEIQRGGKIFDIADEVIQSGAMTSYKKLFVSKNKKNKDKQLIGTFYNLIKVGKVNEDKEIKGKGTVYNISFNYPYSHQIEALKANSVNHFNAIPLKLVRDREVDKSPMLFNFIDYLVYTNGGYETPIKVEKLLIEIGVSDSRIKSRPNECFKEFRKCLSYASINYSELIYSAVLYSEDKEGFVDIGVDSLKNLQNWELQDFKDAYLFSFPTNDFRKCYISFKSNQQKVLPSVNSLELRNALIGQIMVWLDVGIVWQKMKKLTREGTVKYLSHILDEKGEEFLKSAFEIANNNDSINQIFFLSKYLPRMTDKGNKSNSVKSIKDFLADEKQE